MKSLQLRAVIVLAAVVGASNLRADIIVSMSTDKSVYRPGEALSVNVTATNTSDQDALLRFVDGRQGHYTLDDAYHFPEGWTLALTSRAIPANSSYTWSLRHNWLAYNLNVGTHRAAGGVAGYGDAGPVNFDVVAPTLPTSGFTIDFENAPGSQAPVQSLTEYWPLGVHFRSNTTANPPRRPGIYDGHLAINSTTYPPGFNIAADFDMSIHGASADVSAAVGVQITMIAKDKDGNVLDTSVSDPVPALGSFVPVSVSSTRDIATVEWWPSNQGSTVMVDNLALAMPEPGGMVLIALGTALLLRRRS
jgi:hypothetical protein